MDIPEPTAEEIAADVLMAVHEKLPSFRIGGRGKLTTWIFEIAKNRAIDYHRAPKSKLESLDVSMISAEYGEPEPLDQSDPRMAWICNQLAELSNQDQQILKWRALDFPFAQIGEWLGMNEGTVRVRHKRLLDKLKEQARGTALSGDAIYG
jgi:RNA polymerase sigma factor (sigma-70 family)